MLSNKVSEIMTPEIISAEAASPVSEVIQTMVARDIGRIIVIKDDLPVGIFTERHVMKHIANSKLDRTQTPVETVMTAPFRAVREDTHIVEALGEMVKENIRHLQVLGARDNIVGIVSMRRILELAVELGRDLKESKTVASLVSRPPLCLDHDNTVSAAVEQMNLHKATAVVAVADGRPVGIFTERDVLNRVVSKNIDCATTAIRTVMTAPLMTMPVDALVGAVLDQMYRHDIRNMPIVNSSGDLVGVLTMPDVVQFAKAFDIDETVRRTWREINNFYDSQDYYTPG